MILRENIASTGCCYQTLCSTVRLFIYSCAIDILLMSSNTFLKCFGILVKCPCFILPFTDFYTYQLVFLSRLNPLLSCIPCSEQSFPRNRNQDISFNDQCANVLRYVVGERAKKRLVRLVNVDNSSGKCLNTLLQNSLAEIGLILEQCNRDSLNRVIEFH